MGDEESDVAQTVELVPDRSITDAIGRGHTLTTAVADIIDNSLDAKAERILIRFVVEDDRLVAVRIRDDGEGMVPAMLLDAMTLGKRHQRSEAALGHFGIGLKAASLSQALTLTVFTRHFDAAPCAMRIRRGSFAGAVLDEAAARRGYEWDSRGPASTGTVVEWRDLETISYSQIAAERRSWLERTITGLSHSLGLTFHRLIQQRGVRITIDVWDQRTQTAGPPRTIEPRDPFQFSLTGKAAYPTVITALTSDGAPVIAECFILPPRSDSSSVWLLGRSPVEWQGVYIYRNDRLLQAGGWLDIRPSDKRLRLARLRIDLTPALERHLRLRHEKSGVTPTPEFSAALEAATNDFGVTLDSFRADAQEVLRVSNMRASRVKPAVRVEEGLPDRVIESVREELGEGNEDPIRIEWEMLPEGRIFEMELERRRVVFNLGYRGALGGGDAVLVPTLVYLLLETYFTKGWLREGTKAQIDAWQKIAATAMLVDLGDSAYDSLANWSRWFSAPIAAGQHDEEGSAPSLGPKPSPSSADLRWAHLGQRGETIEFQAVDDSGALPEDLPNDGPESVIEQVGVKPDRPVQARDHASAGRSEASSEPGADQRDDDSSASQTEHDVNRSAGKLPFRLGALPTNVQPGDREIVAMYRTETDLEMIASALGVEPRHVAFRLCALLLDLAGDDVDDVNLAAMHGQPYTPGDRERILEMYRGGASVRRIAAQLMRTPFAIAWQLLSSPKRPVEVPKEPSVG